MKRRNHMRPASEKRRIAKEYARAIRKGERGRDVLEKYGVSVGQVMAWLRGKGLGKPGRARRVR